MANQIEYVDKEALVTNPNVAEKNKVTASDMNQIKTKHNALDTAHTATASTLSELAAGFVDKSSDTNITFSSVQGHIYNLSGVGRSGNVTIDMTGAIAGSRVYIKHNDSTAPTISGPDSIVYIGGAATLAADYQASSDNYIELFVVKTSTPNLVFARILQSTATFTQGTVQPILSGTGAPASGLGQDGDFYFDLTTGAAALYGPKASGAWPTGISLVGPAGNDGTDGTNGVDGNDGAEGESGIDGTNGVDGNTILTLSAPPTSEGSDGDYAIVNGTDFYGPKASGTWPTSFVVFSSPAPSQTSTSAIDLSNVNGNFVGSGGSPITATSLTFTNSVTGGHALVLISSTSAPTLPSNTIEIGMTDYDTSTNVKILQVLCLDQASSQHIVSYCGSFTSVSSGSGLDYSTIPNIFAWYKVSDISVGDGNNVSSISDIIGTNTLTSLDTDNLYDATEKKITINRALGNYFSGALDSTLTPPYSVVMCMKDFAQLSTSQYVWSNGVGHANTGSIGLTGRGGANDAFRVNNEGTTGTQVDYTTGNTFVITVIVNGSGASSIYLNNTLISGTDSYTADMANLVIGAAAESSGSLSNTGSVLLGDFGIINGAIGTSDLSSIVSDLATIYGFTP